MVPVEPGENGEFWRGGLIGLRRGVGLDRDPGPVRRPGGLEMAAQEELTLLATVVSGSVASVAKSPLFRRACPARERWAGEGDAVWVNVGLDS